MRIILVLWTLGIWGSRIRNILGDDELVGFERASSIGIAAAFLLGAALTGVALATKASWLRFPLIGLIALGIARWTVRGPIILASSEWEVSFKVVHTILWLVTVLLSVLAWREHRSADAR